MVLTQLLLNTQKRNQDLRFLPKLLPTEINLHLKAYYDKFEETCQNFDVKGPWSDFQDFKQPAISQGILSLFVWLLLSFSPCVYSRVSNNGSENLKTWNRTWNFKFKSGQV